MVEYGQCLFKIKKRLKLLFIYKGGNILEKKSYDIRQIQEIIPHRYPFYL